MSASEDSLFVEIDVKEAADLERAQAIIDRHLEKFAFRETFTAMDWQTREV